jgi:hypothetical protein
VKTTVDEAKYADSTHIPEFKGAICNSGFRASLKTAVYKRYMGRA